MHETGTRMALTGAPMLLLAGGLLLAPVAAWAHGAEKHTTRPNCKNRPHPPRSRHRVGT